MIILFQISCFDGILNIFLMKLLHKFHRTPLCIAIQIKKYEIAKLLLSNKNINVNHPDISIIFKLMKLLI